MASPKRLRIVYFVLIAVVVHAQSLSPAREQTIFDEQTPIERPMPLPPAGLKSLLLRKEVRLNLQDLNDADRSNPAQLFTATEVHLSSPARTDLIVMGKRPMSGADNSWFWIICSAQKNPTVVLFAGGNSLELLTTKTRGFRDIRSDWSNPNGTQTHIYKFDGARYRLWKETWREHR